MSHRIFVLLQSFFSFFSLLHACEWSPYQCGCAQTPPSTTNRIVGGVEALPHSWPVSTRWTTVSMNLLPLVDSQRSTYG